MFWYFGEAFNFSGVREVFGEWSQKWCFVVVNVDHCIKKVCLIMMLKTPWQTDRVE